ATIENHVLHNGFGCAVMEHLHSQQINTPVARVGWPDEFIDHGAVPLLRKKHGITADALVEKILAVLKKKPAAKPAIAQLRERSARRLSILTWPQLRLAI